MSGNKQFIYEIWYEFYDGTQANLGGYHERLYSYIDKDKAEEKLRELEEDGEIYYIKEVELNG